ncbi:MAG TPA: septal ring lytic transglycosylase RlpA family protein [Verrucomicrobiae bacterium]|nr:septal ring lytic transglycosylase RlpA family protein [Verrucomicrobiae bacterium]
MKKTALTPAVVLLWFWASILAPPHSAQAEPLKARPQQGFASWYGEEHRGKLMANGRPFDPDRFTAASWFYPLGTRVRVTVNAPHFEPRSVLVTITDRGPAKRLVQQGRVIDLGHAAFQKLAQSDLGLVEVVVEPVQ